MPKPVIPELPSDGSLPPILVQGWDAMRAILNSLVRRASVDRDAGSNIWKLGLISADLPSHHTTHEAGGTDPIKLDDLATPDDTTDLDATTGHHGLLKKLSGDAGEFLDGTGNWTTPSSGGLPPDGDYGDIVVSSSGAVWAFDSSVVTTFARTFLDDVDAAAVRTTIGAGTSSFNGVYSSLTGIPSTFAPSGHHASHEAGGSDPIKLDNLDTPDDNTDLNATTAHHGLLLKLDSSATKFLDGSGAWSVPAGTGATAAQLLDATRRARYNPFTTGTDAYEFTGSDLASFTAVDPGTNTPTTTETNDVLSVASPGNDSSSVLHSWVKSATVNANDYVEAWVSCTARSSGTQSIGVMFTDGGTTYGAGTQMKWQLNSTQGSILNLITNFNTAGTGGSQNIQNWWMMGIGIRLKYTGSNNWEGYISLDGVTWCLIQSQTKTLTPSGYGFFVSNTAVSIPANFTFRYIRKGT